MILSYAVHCVADAFFCILPLLTVRHTVLVSELGNHAPVKQIISIRSIKE